MNESPSSEAADESVEASPIIEVPTEAQQKLRRGYTRMMGWYGTPAVILGLLQLYGLVTGRESFFSIVMLTQVALVVALAIPALWANRRRKMLDFYIKYGLDQTPKHLRTWVHMTLLASLVLAGPVIIALPVVFILNANQPSEPTLEEEKAIEVAEIRASWPDALNKLKSDEILQFCLNAARPGGEAVFRQTLLKSLRGPRVLSESEYADVSIQVIREYCGLDR